MNRPTNRQVHRWLSIIVVIPFFIVVTTGCLLQVKRWFPTLQPPSLKSEAGPLKASSIGWDAILTAMKATPEANVSGWKDIKAIDVRPALGVARARTKDGYEVQIDLASGKVLNAGRRWSSLLIEIHEGAYFGAPVRNAVFVPSAFFMLILTITGVSLLVIHYSRTWRSTWLYRTYRRRISVSA